MLRWHLPKEPVCKFLKIRILHNKGNLTLSPGIKFELPFNHFGTVVCGHQILVNGSRSVSLAQEGINVRPCNLHILKTLKLAEEMICLADQGDADREDNGCGILYGILRDSGFKLKKLAEEEKLNHIRKGWWPKEDH